MLLFTAVGWHECCHILVARRLGWQVKRVELLPFGGVALLQRPPGRGSGDEAWIALAGPAASFLLALVLTTLLSLLTGVETTWLLFFRQANLILGLFNLWPGLPLDGGRIYRALRTKRSGLYRATLEGVYWGRALALLLGLASVIGFFYRVMDLQGLALSLFIYWAARREGEAISYMFWQDFWDRRGKSRRESKYLKSGKVFWLVADPSLTLSRVSRSFEPRAFNLVAVVGKSGRLEGIITETEILQELLEGGNNSLDALLRR
ncbi:MAG: hypothetical protein H5T99_03705 [Moorella sp. (in: Bacteria)]|nr:hypothetical protein [Moorella sp. (in: firmicutes)]